MRAGSEISVLLGPLWLTSLELLNGDLQVGQLLLEAAQGAPSYETEEP